MWGTMYPQRILDASWESYKREFIFDGKVWDPTLEITTSEGQSYALLRAVMLDDRQAFDAVYDWSDTNLRNDQGLFSWQWGVKDGHEQVVDTNNATDADTDIALALLMACSKWNESKLCDEAKELMAAIWKHNVGLYDGKPYLLAGNWADNEQELVFNPSYFSPSHYRIFAQFDSNHNWQGLISTSYEALRECSALSTVGLPPEWCALNKETGEYGRPSDRNLDVDYGFNAIRVPLRVAWDYEWFGAVEARDYLSTLRFFEDKWKKDKKIVAMYYADGSEKESYESVAAYAGVYSYFSVVNPSVAEEVYNEKIFSKFYENAALSYWDVEDNYYTQNLGWFATALHAGEFEKTKKDLRF